MWAYNNSYVTLLSVACFFSSLYACQVDPRIQLVRALKNDNKDEISKFITSHSVDIRDDKGNTLLMLFVNGTLPTTVTERLFMINRLIEIGADINAQNNANETALMQVAKRYDIQVFHELLYLKANIQLHDEHNKMVYDRVQAVYHLKEILPAKVCETLKTMINSLENCKRQKLL